MRHLPLIYRNTEPPADYFRLVDPKPDGEVVAYYRSQPVTDVVKDGRGYRYVFAGLAPRHRDGSYDLRHMKEGEVLVEPGLIYQLIPVKRGWMA